ncbi:MAG: DNA primase, partial [Gammaproteobacteria bacterium]|nr:DNA primase [Gammaproteobacteria bacterium]
MSGRISDDKIEEIRDRTDMVQLVSSYVSLKRSGVNHFGLCPFHSEKSPSFSVNSARQRYHCFGCGEDGDAFSFLMKMEGLSFPEAIRTLGERVGVVVEEERPDPEAERRRRERETLHRINETVADFYHRILMKSPEGEPARRYLKGRGYDGTIAARFQLGYAPEGWETLAGFLDREGVEAERARVLGLIRPGKDGRSDYDLFRGRLIFPIDGKGGRVAAFGGRTLGDGQPKYINSPESPVYHKSRVLYGMDRSREAIRRAGEVIVVEGYFDLLALYRAGIENVVATCGTALTEDHARMIRRYADTVRLLFDQDEAGRTATFRAMEALLPAGLSVSVVALEAG